MVSRGYEAPIAQRSNWITERPNLWISGGWLAILGGATLLTAQTAMYIFQHGLVATRPPLSPAQIALRIVLVLGASAFLFLRRDPLERAALVMGIVAPGSSALFGFGLPSPLLAAVRLLSHLVLYILSAVVASRVLRTMQREFAGRA